MKLDIINSEGSKTGKSVELPDDIFAIEPNEHAVYLAVKQHLANKRQGTHKSKERGEVKGSTRKIKRQKGTGTARAGDIKNPLFRGGGRVFGPKPHTYDLKINKKVRQLARKSALTSKASGGNIIVVEDFTLDSAKTQQFAKVLDNLGMTDKKNVFVTGDYDNKLYLSSRNIKKTNVTRAQDLSTYQVMNAGTLILAESAIERIKETFA